MSRAKLILTVSGKPKVVFWFGIACLFVTLFVIWADFVPYPISLLLASVFGYVGGLCLLQSGDLVRRRKKQPRRIFYL